MRQDSSLWGSAKSATAGTPRTPGFASRGLLYARVARVALSTVAALAASFASLTLIACTTEEGASPDCTQDIDQNGNKHDAKGCNQYALCLDKDGNLRDPAECCKGFEAEGDRLLCLQGYGVKVTLPSGATTGAQGGGGAGGGGTGGQGGDAGGT